MGNDSDDGGSAAASFSVEERRRKRPHKKKSSSRTARDDDDDEKRRSKKPRKRDDGGRKYRKKSSKKRKKRRKKSDSSSSSSSSSSDSDSDTKKMVVNERLLAKLAARGETLEERKARRAEQRGAQIAQKFGYTAEENPFGDANLHETFTWKKRDDARKKDAFASSASSSVPTAKQKSNTFDEIEKVRRRRQEREEQFEEMERLRAEESRMKELENYDDWARKEEEFHLRQQRQRSAIRLVEGREKPIDVLAKNILMFGLSDEEKKNRASVKYQERYDAMDAVEALEAELEEPPVLLKILKQAELRELMIDIDAFCRLEREAAATAFPGASAAVAASCRESNPTNNTVLQYWDNVRIVAADEIKYLESGGKEGRHATMVREVAQIFLGQSLADLKKMKVDIDDKLRRHASDASLFQTGGSGEFDRDYWIFVQEQLLVHIAKADLSDLHGQMLVRQLERLEKRKEQLAAQPEGGEAAAEEEDNEPARNPALPENVATDFGDLEEELGLRGEVDLEGSKNYSWQDKYRPRKPRYFNRVKTGYDWNKYNQTHYDKDNPPPKTVQGYKFNIFYPDLIDATKTPQYFLEPADTEEFCIIRFRAGPPYEDLAFKIINREWNRSRKRGFKCTFERGVLSLYFNFTTHWYRK